MLRPLGGGNRAAVAITVLKIAGGGGGEGVEAGKEADGGGPSAGPGRWERQAVEGDVALQVVSVRVLVPRRACVSLTRPGSK